MQDTSSLGGSFYLTYGAFFFTQKSAAANWISLASHNEKFTHQSITPLFSCSSGTRSENHRVMADNIEEKIFSQTLDLFL